MPPVTTVADNIGLILKFQSLTALCPKYVNTRRKFTKQKKYACVLISLYTLWLCLAMFLKYNYVLNVNPEDVILYGLPSVLTAMANIIVIWKSNVSPNNDHQVIFDCFNAIDSNRKSRFGRIKHPFLDFAMITLLSLAMVVYNLYQAYFVKQSISFYVYYLHDRVHLYLTFVLVLFQRYVLRSVEVRAAILNRMIERVEFDCFNVAMVYRTKVVEGDLVMMVRIHAEICDAADAFNRLYGWSVLFTMVQILIGIVAQINLILYYFIAWSYLLLPILWNIYITAQGVLLTRECEHVNNECERTAPLCFKTMQRFCPNKLLRDKLLLLAQQATQRNPRFSAAGFFNVDYNMIFTFTNIITTYVIVLIQFKS